MLQPILRMVRVAAVLTIVIALSGHKLMRSAVADPEGPKCEAGDGTWCAGIGFYPNAHCSGTVRPCTTCGEGSGSCAGHGGYRTAET